MEGVFGYWRLGWLFWFGFCILGTCFLFNLPTYLFIYLTSFAYGPLCATRYLGTPAMEVVDFGFWILDLVIVLFSRRSLVHCSAYDLFVRSGRAGRIGIILPKTYWNIV